MKLKTLKDIGTDGRCISKIPMVVRDELKEELKEEAIKWIKYLESLNDKKLTLWHGESIEFIKHFFNIEVEDKEVKNARK